ncbi:MAG: LysM peptidoglycan-binding domain-containing protein [Clostridia bacterium]|nr:LysM peptidoglycan-binding domain-containing protein [Clostridia bacterium]
MTELAMPLDLESMNEIFGGAFKKPRAKAGYIIYQITATDTLIRIANKFGISSYKKILKWNPKIHNPRLIRTGDYLYIKK